MSKPLFVITVAAPTTAELRRRRDAASQAGADIVELRLDSVSDPDVTAALAGRMSPVIVTCRPEWEGGAFKDDEGERKKILDCRCSEVLNTSTWIQAAFHIRADCVDGRQAHRLVHARFRRRAARPERAGAHDACRGRRDRQGRHNRALAGR